MTKNRKEKRDPAPVTELPYSIQRTWGKVRRGLNTFHYHQGVQMDVVLKGEVKYLMDKKEILVKEGEGIFINAHTLHCTQPNGADYISVKFHPILLSASEYIEKTFLTPILQNASLPYVCLSDEIPWQNDILETLRAFYMQKSAGAEDMPLLAISQFYYIWHTLYTMLPKEEGTHTESAHMSTMRKMVGFIQKNYRNTITLQDIADAGSVSISQCSLLFREIIKDSPYHFLMDYRLEQARLMLCETDDSITEVTERCGFPDTSHFIRQFRTAYGITPLQYRKSQQ